jgi:hypothetical protein
MIASRPATPMRIAKLPPAPVPVPVAPSVPTVVPPVAVASGGGGGGGFPPIPGQAAPSRGGSLKVETTHLSPGYLRKNGVPYSENTVLTEYYDRTNETDGNSYLIITTIVEDPKYLTGQFITSTHFKKEADGSKFSPSSCSAK